LIYIDMNRLGLIAFLVFSTIIICASCNKEELEKENIIGIKNISFENYPKVDGSTSSSVLNVMIACKLLGVPYHWVGPGIVTEWTLQPVYTEIPEQYKNFFWQNVKSSRTHGAFMNLIDGEADIILTH